MPLFYANAGQEHSAVRESAGIFDISHMGQVTVKGAEAETFLNTQFTNDTSRLKVGRSHYSFLLNEEGGVIDDLLLYRLSAETFFIIFNGARVEEAVSVISDAAPDGVEIRWEKDIIGLALQGPRVSALAPELIGSEIPEKRNFIFPTEHGIAATTGYTGEHGFEWFGQINEGIQLWEKALSLGISPCGLVARDSLRLEAGLPLNGQDLSREVSPLQAGLGFAVKLKKDSPFRGKKALTEGAFSEKTLCAFTSTGPIPRTGYKVSAGDEEVGTVSSGGRPPGYKNTIGLAWIKKEFTSSHLDMMVRDKRFPLTLTELPFLKK